MRNTEKQAEQGRAIINKHSRIDLSTMELYQILRHINDEVLTYEEMIDQIYRSVTEAFYMGVAVGHRNK